MFFFGLVDYKKNDNFKQWEVEKSKLEETVDCY